MSRRRPALPAKHSSAQARSVITITGIGDHDRPDWLITMNGMRNCLVVVMKRGNARGAKGVGHSRRLLGQRETGGTQRFRRKAPAFVEWHEPDELRGSSPVL